MVQFLLSLTDNRNALNYDIRMQSAMKRFVVVILGLNALSIDMFFLININAVVGYLVTKCLHRANVHKINK
jgi:hypothetical protein